MPPPQTQRKRSNETYKEKKQTTNQGNPSVIEQRLKTIENLHKKGILSEEEYQKKRSEILKGI